MKIIKITLISLLLVGTVGCISHDTKPVEFEAYSYHVTMDKDGTITYRKVAPVDEE
jgi:hypothetical protein